MKKIFYVFFLMAGISLASVNVSNAQCPKDKVACCSKEKMAECAAKSVPCTAMTTTSTAKKDCPMKAGVVADAKACPAKTSACTGKPGVVAEAKPCAAKTAACCAKSAAVAAVDVKEK